MTDRNAAYQATYRRRSAFNAQATLLGWTKLEILAAYVTGSSELVVIDKDGARYGTDADALAAPVLAPDTLVAPAEIRADEFGPKWQAARERLAKGVATLDLSEKDRAFVLTSFEQLAATALRAVELIREHNGPDWREALGIDS